MITVDEGKSLHTEQEWVEGMQFDRGYHRHTSSPTLLRWKLFLKMPMCSSLRRKSATSKQVPLLEKVVQQGKPLLIIARMWMAKLLLPGNNRLRGTFTVAAVKAPGYGDRRKAMMEDIAILTGGSAIFEALG